MKFLALLLLLPLASTLAAPIRVAEGGRALLPVVHDQNASEPVRRAATDLAAILGRMTGGTFSVEAGGEPRGIVVGTVKQIPSTPGAGQLDPADVLRREEYLIHSDGKTLWLVGASDAGASHAVWDFLHRLGYRQYFPGDNWEIVPKKDDLTADFTVFETPAYTTRHFAWHYGNWSDLEAGTTQWAVRNRIALPAVFPEVFVLRTSHVYGAIINRFRETFDSHPGMRSIVEGKPTGKLNPANPETLKVAQQYAAEFFEKNPEATSISMDPSDGGGWGTSPEELAIGTPSDRAVLLANVVAEFINQTFGQKFVGIYAYNEHSPAPTRVKVNPAVIVSFATAFIHGGSSVEELMKAWGAMGSQLMGIREYHSVAAWDLSRPTGGRAANLHYLQDTIPRFHALGARFYTTEAGQNWGSQGLGNYFTTRVTWNLQEAGQREQIVGRFVKDCFPEAREQMLLFYRELLHPAKSLPLSRDLIGRMYRTLADARKQTTDPASLRRMDDLILYTRYSELLMAYVNSRSSNLPPKAQQAAMEEAVKFAYRTRASRMVSSLAIYRDVANPRRNKALTPVDGTDWKIPEGKNPWKSSAPYTAEELEEFLVQGIANNPLLDFEPVAFSRDLVPATTLPATTLASAARPPRPVRAIVRGNNQFLTWTDSPSAGFQFSGQGGITYTNRGDVTVSLFRWDPATGEQGAVGEAGEGEEPVFAKAEAEVILPPDKQDHPITLQPTAPGLHIIQSQDSAGGFQIQDWPATAFFTIEASSERTFNTIGRTDAVLYVPKGTKKIGAFTRGRGRILDPEGTVAHTLTGEAGFISLPVPEGQDGAYWRFEGMVGARLQLLTVPPYLAPSPAQMLLPKEVVEADQN